MDCLRALAGKVVIITGASAGIGARTALEFAKLGSRLTLTGRNKDRLKKTAEQCIAAGLKEDDVLPVIADITIEDDIKKVVDETIEKFQTIHVLVNNAGTGTFGNITDAPVTILDEQFNMHVRSVYSLTKLSLDHLKRNKGSVVNVSSLASTRPLTIDTAYSVAKAAQDQLTRCMALDLAPYGIRVNSVNPAYIRSDIASALGYADSDSGVAEFYKKMGPAHPLGRVGEVEDVARVIVFLASDAAAFITGSNTPVDGGMAVTHREPADDPTKTQK